MNDNANRGPARRGRPRTGTLERRGLRWFGRLTVEIDGETIRRWFDLDTESKAVARRKLAKLAKEHAAGDLPSPEAGKAPETVDTYAEAWLESRERRGVATVGYERVIYNHVWKRTIGTMALGAVTAATIRGVLADCAEGRILPKKRLNRKAEPKRYSRQSITHIRAVAYRLFDAAWRDELVSENRVERVEIPEVMEEKKPRAILTDDEVATLIAHPNVDAEIKLLVLLSRTLGGLRAGDLNAMTWDAFSPNFETLTFVRRKTKRKRPTPQTFEVPAGVRAYVDAWWHRHDCPTEGAVFPVRKGPRAGQVKKRSNMSYADRLRRELITAGVTRNELHHQTSTTLPVDFHSTRRAYATALARVGMNEQQARVLTGHADSSVHRRYLEMLEVRSTPAAALPYVDPNAAALVANRPERVAKSKKARSEIEPNSGYRGPDLNRRHHAYESGTEGPPGNNSAEFVPEQPRTEPTETAGNEERGQKEQTIFATGDPSAEVALNVLLRGRADRLAAELVNAPGRDG